MNSSARNCLSPVLRERWNRIVCEEGARLGLSKMRAFLENKMVNDVFYKGLCHGVPCIVKCSSRAPDSIENEFKLASAVYEADHEVCARPLALWRSSDGKSAFVVFEEVQGPSLTELTTGASMLSDVVTDSAARDFIRMADALDAAHVVHRDLGMTDNYLLGADGHFKLIDFQFAVDRRTGCRDPWLARHRKYHFCVFSGERTPRGASWNDCYYLYRTLKLKFPVTAEKTRVLEELARRIPSATFEIPFDWMTLLLLSVFGFGLRLTMLFRSKKSKRYQKAEWRALRLRTNRFSYDVQETPPVISVIVPVYGVAEYLRQCVDSLLIQSLCRIEIILVDDGSPDVCPALCDEYACKDSRVRVIHKANGGLSSARNAGLDVATAPYVMFCDGDDLLSRFACEELFCAAESTGADAVCGNVQLYWEPGCRVLTKYRQKLERYFRLPRVACRRIGTYEKTQLAVTAPTKLFRRSVLEANGIRFPPGLYHEDDVFHWLFMTASSYIAYVDKPLYVYRQRAFSIMTNDDPDFRLKRDIDYFKGYALVADRVRGEDRALLAETCVNRFKSLAKGYVSEPDRLCVLETACADVLAVLSVPPGEDAS